MPENAQDEISQWLDLYNDLQNSTFHCTQTQMQLLAKGLAMQQAGVISMDNDPDRIFQQLKEQDKASLR